MDNIFHKNTVWTNIMVGSNLARGANTWGPFAVRAEDERGVDPEEQPGRGRRLQQLQPGEPCLKNPSFEITFWSK